MIESEVTDKLLIFACEKWLDNKLSGYVLFAFDIFKNRHNTLIFKERLNFLPE